MAWTVKCPTCGFRNVVAGLRRELDALATPCTSCGRPLGTVAVQKGERGTPPFIRCSVFVGSSTRCSNPAVRGSHMCGEHAALIDEIRKAAEEERQAEERAAVEETERRKKAAEELRARLAPWASASEDLAEDLDRRLLADRHRLAEQRRWAAERARRWMAERAEERRLGTEASSLMGVRRLEEERRLEAAIARRRWKEKAANRKNSDPASPGSPDN